MPLNMALKPYNPAYPRFALPVLPDAARSARQGDRREASPEERMPKYKTEDIRNSALVGHGSTGKTTLAEAMLFAAGATKRMGSIDDGTSLFDFEPDEKERKSSIDLAIAHGMWEGRQFNVLDTPGYLDFIG